MSTQLLLNFTMNQLEDCRPVSTLSVFIDKILISFNYNFSQLFIYSHVGLHLSTIIVIDTDKLWDVALALCCNMVYTTFNSNKVVVMLEIGEIITTHTRMKYPRCLSVSIDDTISD